MDKNFRIVNSFVLTIILLILVFTPFIIHRKVAEKYKPIEVNNWEAKMFTPDMIL